MFGIKHAELCGKEMMEDVHIVSDNCQDTCRIKKFVRYFDNLFHNFCSIRSAY